MIREQVGKGNLIEVLQACAVESRFQREEADNVGWERAANGESLSWMDCAEMDALAFTWELQEKHLDHCITCIEGAWTCARSEPPPL